MQVRGSGGDHLVEQATDPPAGDDPGGPQHSQVTTIRIMSRETKILR